MILTDPITQITCSHSATDPHRRDRVAFGTRPRARARAFRTPEASKSRERRGGEKSRPGDGRKRRSVGRRSTRWSREVHQGRLDLKATRSKTFFGCLIIYIYIIVSFFWFATRRLRPSFIGFLRHLRFQDPKVNTPEAFGSRHQMQIGFVWVPWAAGGRSFPFGEVRGFWQPEVAHSPTRKMMGLDVERWWIPGRPTMGRFFDGRTALVGLEENWVGS